MSPPSTGIARIAVIRIAAIAAAGSFAWAAAALFGIDPLAPTLVASLIMLAKLAVTYRTEDTE
ncbi:MAG TPA: hypothetical protein VJ550_00045 [Geomonas sp.]|nr:hypothetical protein [Geomonas sp.]